MTAFFNNVMAQLNAGTIGQDGAVDLLSGYGSTKLQKQLFYNIETASGRLPYGAGFNGFATSNPSTLSGLGVAGLPSGAPDLDTLLTFSAMERARSAPSITISSMPFLGTAQPDFNAVGQAVSHSAIVTRLPGIGAHRGTTTSLMV